MVRQGPVVSSSMAAMLLVALPLLAQPAAKTARREDAPPIDRQPYRIQVHVAIDPDADVRGSFNVLVELVFEGYFADPANGGNRDAVAWRASTRSASRTTFSGSPAIPRSVR